MRELTGKFFCIMDAIAFDYVGKFAGRTFGSRRVAVRANRSTQLTRAFAPLRGANHLLSGTFALIIDKIIYYDKLIGGATFPRPVKRQVRRSHLFCKNSSIVSPISLMICFSNIGDMSRP
jgi:hypothetical protein